MKISQEYLKSRLSYDPLTGIFVWLHQDNFPTQWNNVHAGRAAGGIKIHPKGYRYVQISILGRAYIAHRLAWLYMVGGDLPESIDHKNRDATDNRWENLRDSNGMNQRNRSKNINNKSGITGVCWDTRKAKWLVMAGSTYLGRYDDIEVARSVVEDFRVGRFDPMHGMIPTPYSQESAK